MLFNINTLEWDGELCELFGIPQSILPEVKDSSCIYGYTDPKILGASLPIAGVAGDQQAALFGQGCFETGDVKNTYGTGGFLLMNTGDSPKFTDNGLLTTIAWRIGGKVSYAVEGSVFTAGAAIQWLRDGLKIIESAQDSEYYARKVEDTGGVIVVPAFQGLGAPYWDAYARGMIIGITRGTTKNHIIRATLESLAYQTADVIALMEAGTGITTSRLKVDGGASANELLLEMQADLVGIELMRPMCVETTALGAAMLAGLALGVYSEIDELSAILKNARCILPSRDNEWRTLRMKEWRRAVERCLAWK